MGLMSSVGFEPTKHIAFHLEWNPFDHLGNLTNFIIINLNGRIRTSDIRIYSPLFFQLNYVELLFNLINPYRISD